MANEKKACLDSNLKGDNHDYLNVARIFVENGDERHAELKHTNDQKRILDAIENQIKSGEQIFLCSWCIRLWKINSNKKIKEVASLGNMSHCVANKILKTEFNVILKKRLAIVCETTAVREMENDVEFLF